MTTRLKGGGSVPEGKRALGDTATLASRISAGQLLESMEALSSELEAVLADITALTDYVPDDERSYQLLTQLRHSAFRLEEVLDSLAPEAPEDEPS